MTNDELDQFTKSKISELVEQGTAKSTLRAYKQDRERFWRWAKQHHDLDEGYPVPIEVIIAFILEHLEGNGVTKLKVSTIKRYLSSLAIAHQERGFASPVSHPKIKLLIRRARRAYKNQQPVQKLAATAEIIDRMVATCDNTLHGIRNRALILVGFSAGGRRRAELSELDVDDVMDNGNGTYLLKVRSSKTDQEGEGHFVPVTGRAANALSDWVSASGIHTGRLFRGIKRNGELMPDISGTTICRVVQKAAAMAGLDEKQFGAHSLRAGFMTEAVKHNVPMLEAMELSGHKTLIIAQRYYRNDNVQKNRAANLLDTKKLDKE